MSNNIVFTNQELLQLAEQTAVRILKHFSGNPPKNDTILVYGIPRGGIPASYLVLPFLNGHKYIIGFANSPGEATLFLDDLVDSGRTKSYFTTTYPTTPFFSLYEKKSSDGWVSFPWEVGYKGRNSEEDVAVRLLQYIGEDIKREGLQETPKRFLKAWKFWTRGYQQDPKDVLKVFEDGAESYNQMVLVKDIPVHSKCEHHLADIFGVAHVAYIPNGKIVGLSKLSRIVDLFARRLQVQERLTTEIANCLNDNLKPAGVGVVLNCRHMCMESRGVCNTGTVTSTSALLGAFKTQLDTRSEFFQMVNSKG